MKSMVNPQHIVLFHHFRRFLVEAEKAKIDVAPLKGAHLVTSVYPSDVDRGVMSDVDFLVRPVHFAKAGALLEEMGFYRKHEEDAGHAMHEVSYYFDVGPERRFMFEAHQYLCEPVRFPLDHEGIWRRSAASDFDGVPCRRLAPEDHYAHIVLHGVLERLTHIGKVLQDLEMLVRHGNVDLNLVVERAREWRLTRAVWLLTRLVDASAPELGLAMVVRALAPPKAVRAALDFAVSKGRTETRFSHLHYSLQAAFIWSLILDSPLQVARLATTHPYARYCVGNVRSKLGI
jgi:hypothetical protein